MNKGRVKKCVLQPATRWPQTLLLHTFDSLLNVYSSSLKLWFCTLHVPCYSSLAGKILTGLLSAIWKKGLSWHMRQKCKCKKKKKKKRVKLEHKYACKSAA